MISTLISVAIVLLLLGVAHYFLKEIPIAAPFKIGIYVVIVIILLVAALYFVPGAGRLG